MKLVLSVYWYNILSWELWIELLSTLLGSRHTILLYRRVTNFALYKGLSWIYSSDSFDTDQLTDKKKCLWFYVDTYVFKEILINRN